MGVEDAPVATDKNDAESSQDASIADIREVFPNHSSLGLLTPATVHYAEFTENSGTKPPGTTMLG
jgi:hypothetical protein